MDGVIVVIAGIVVALISAAVGFYFGIYYRDDKELERLRKRGYAIETNRFGDLRWVYRGFDKNAKSIRIDGPWVDTVKQAIANADAHHYAKIISSPLEEK